MTAHILFKNIDPEWPVTLSEKFLKDMIRKDLGYKRLVITDDLDMKALAKHYDRAMIPVRALQAGANYLLYCNEPDSPPIALDAIEKAIQDKTLTAETIEQNYKIVMAVKQERLTNPDPLPLEKALALIGHPEHLRLSKAIAAREVPSDISA